MLELLALDDYASFEDIVPEFINGYYPSSTQATAVINLSGSITPGGSLNNVLEGADTVDVAGVTAPTGDVVEFAIFIDSLVGEIEPIGSLSIIKALSLDLGGEIEPFGVLVSTRVNKILVGSITPVGTLATATQPGSLVLGGSIEPTGSVSNIHNQAGGGDGSTAGGRKKPVRPKLRRDR